ncbi:exosortase Y-associated Wzy-like protein [Mucilaginibacter sp.]|uniref:exosortase Y-associated Wzy-like protein n=1 Tax=Mucilaginibacter sp. TaxID=1882438 RepID=UPI00284E701C|nr:hypothetical protein [Mucilaginibacter sp.]MDR3695478.1 hypothetical protein [Mucilaginibacter sp.]
MDKNQPIERYLVLFLPFGIALLFQSDPVLSYFIAWIGTNLIFYLSLSGWVKPLPTDRPIAEQVMRPIFLVQIIFAGYMSWSSIFYFLNLLGYDNFQKTDNVYFVIDHQKVELTALCQRYYVLGHAAFVIGISAFMKYPVKKKYHIETAKLANVLFITAIVTLPLSVLFLKIPGLQQFYFQFSSLSFIAGTLALAFAIPLKKIWNTAFCVLLYTSNFYEALISGFKEPIIISVLVLGLFLYPNYKKLVMVIFVPALLILFIFLPTYNQVFRENNWSGDIDADDAYKLALDATIKSEQSGDDSSWGFLVYRLSEVDMFTEFVQSTPSNIDYYGLQLLKQSAIAVIPRAFWPSKPSTEELVMERVYDAGVIRRGANVSAKPAYIVDAYLSWGIPGILIGLFLYGAVAQLVSLKAEYLFGGYTLGTALIFSGLFQIFWRGLSFEFLVNSVFWSYVSMLIIFRILRYTGVLEEV